MVAAADTDKVFTEGVKAFRRASSIDGSYLSPGTELGKALRDYVQARAAGRTADASAAERTARSWIQRLDTTDGLGALDAYVTTVEQHIR